MFPTYLDAQSGDPPDPKSLAFVSGIEFEDILSRLSCLISAREAAHLLHLVKVASLGPQSRTPLAAELNVSERTVERNRVRVPATRATTRRKENQP
jgi:hypothetical protein